MAQHEVEISAQIDEEPDTDPVTASDLFRDVSAGGGGSTYMVVITLGDMVLVDLSDGMTYAPPDDEPFVGDRADFRRIPGNRKITIE